MLYLPNFDIWSIPITITPLASQPGQPAYAARGIYRTGPVDLLGVDGSVISEQITECDIREAEFPVLPRQGDHLNISVDCNNDSRHVGDFEILDADTNGGGVTVLALRKLVAARP